jgi:hypothetical protein
MSSCPVIPRWDPERGDLPEISGVVMRLPEPGSPAGNSVLLRTPGGDIRHVPATAKRGHAVLERELAGRRVQVGDRIRISYRGRRETASGLREYRSYFLEVLP